VDNLPQAGAAGLSQGLRLHGGIDHATSLDRMTIRRDRSRVKMTARLVTTTPALPCLSHPHPRLPAPLIALSSGTPSASPPPPVTRLSAPTHCPRPLSAEAVPPPPHRPALPPTHRRPQPSTPGGHRSSPSLLPPTTWGTLTLTLGTAAAARR
jgi:hypothetical protein